MLTSDNTFPLLSIAQQWQESFTITKEIKIYLFLQNSVILEVMELFFLQLSKNPIFCATSIHFLIYSEKEQD